MEMVEIEVGLETIPFFISSENLVLNPLSSATFKTQTTSLKECFLKEAQQNCAIHLFNESSINPFRDKILHLKLIQQQFNCIYPFIKFDSK